MSAENVALVRSFQPDPDVDVMHLVNDDDAAARMREQIGDCFDPEVACSMHFPGMAPVTYPGGLDGLRRAWLGTGCGSGPATGSRSRRSSTAAKSACWSSIASRAGTGPMPRRPRCGAALCGRCATRAW